MLFDQELIHYGIGHDDDPPGRGSGRFEWGSGDVPYQHQFNFLSEYRNLKQKGLKDAEIAKMLLGQKAVKKDGTIIWANTTDLRAELAIANKQTRQVKMQRAWEVFNECNGNYSEAARRLGIRDTSLRSLLDPAIAERTNKYENTAKFLKDRIKEVGMIDVSSGTEHLMGVTESTKKVAMAMLEKEGYKIAKVRVPQLGTTHETDITVLAPPGMTYGEIQKNKYNIKPIQEFTPDGGVTWFVPEFPSNLSSKRVLVRYAEEGGKDKDGVIELRRGVKDISLGGSNYAQVRIAVDGTNYLKGMAVYSDDIPEGYDVIVNSNKHKGTPLIDKSAVYDPKTGTWSGKEVSKRLKINNATGEVDQENPFGALIKAGGQRHYTDEKGKDQLSPINKLQEEGDWDSWSRTLSSQFLSKQPMKLINQQLDLSVKHKQAELSDIMDLTNPVIKKKCLEDFARQADSDASDLVAKGFKNQAYQVLLPIPSLKDDEIYAPNYKDGEMVALVRYPHGGTFEIPILKVNNKGSKEAKSVIGNARDAVGINPKVAERLSGADFDGDTATVIPMTSNKIAVKSTNALKQLEGFDPKELYKLPDGAPSMKNSTKQNEMGKVTNLITDMTVQGATEDQIARAVRHSMVVIDAEKHHLDYKRSAKENRISELKKEYQERIEKGSVKSGASTILSRASAEAHVEERKEITDPKRMTPEQLKRWNEGKVVYEPTGKTKKVQIQDTSIMTPKEVEAYNAGKKIWRESSNKVTQKVSQMDLVDDAMDLVRDRNNPKEVAYARYANNLKEMANKARREARSIKSYPVSQEAKKTYAKEVKSLQDQLIIAQSNSPRERQAQVIANAITREKFISNPDMDFEHRQRERARALTEARAMVGANKKEVVISDREWEAIQARAISSTKLTQILNNTNQDTFRERATPRTNSSSLSEAKIALAKSMASSGMYTYAEIAERLGVSASYVSNIVNS